MASSPSHTTVNSPVTRRGDADFDIAEFGRRRPETLFEGGTTVYVKSPEDTILRKLLWYRMGGEASDRKWSDILGVLQVQGGRLDREYLAKWAAQLRVEDLLAQISPPSAS